MPRENRCLERIDAKREKMPRENRCRERIDAKRFILRGRRSIKVKLECDFSWQAQDFVTFWEIAGVRNINTKSSPRSDE